MALLGLFASPISGASMNPARSLDPEIVSTDYTGWWVYVVGPVIGAAIAVAIITAVRGLPRKEEREAAEGGDLPILGSPSGKGRPFFHPVGAMFWHAARDEIDGAESEVRS